MHVSSPRSMRPRSGSLPNHFLDRRPSLPTESTRRAVTVYSGPARFGSATGPSTQKQNDVFGAALDRSLLHTRRSARLPRRLWPIVQNPSAVRQSLGEADAGDLGGAREARTLRLLEADVLGPLDRSASGRDPGDGSTGEVGRGFVREIRRDILGTARLPRRSLVHHYGSAALDASKPCWPRSSASYPRLRQTEVRAFWRGKSRTELTEVVSSCHRRRDRRRALRKEGTFPDLVLLVRLVSALAIIGERDGSRPYGSGGLLRVASPPPLRRGVRRRDRPSPGNFPQAFSHTLR